MSNLEKLCDEIIEGIQQHRQFHIFTNREFKLAKACKILLDAGKDEAKNTADPFKGEIMERLEQLKKDIETAYSIYEKTKDMDWPQYQRINTIVNDLRSEDQRSKDMARYGTHPVPLGMSPMGATGN